MSAQIEALIRSKAAVPTSGTEKSVNDDSDRSIVKDFPGDDYQAIAETDQILDAKAVTSAKEFVHFVDIEEELRGVNEKVKSVSGVG